MFYIAFAHPFHSVPVFVLDKSMNVQVVSLSLVTFPSAVSNNHIISVSLKSTFSVTNLLQRTHLLLPSHMKMYLDIITTAT